MFYENIKNIQNVWRHFAAILEFAYKKGSLRLPECQLS